MCVCMYIHTHAIVQDLYSGAIELYTRSFDRGSRSPSKSSGQQAPDPKNQRPPKGGLRPLRRLRLLRPLCRGRGRFGAVVPAVRLLEGAGDVVSGHK